MAAMGPDPPDDFHVNEGASVTKLSASALGKRKATAVDTENKKAQQQMSHTQREYVHARRCITPEPHTKMQPNLPPLPTGMSPSAQIFNYAPGGDMYRGDALLWNAYFPHYAQNDPGPGPYYRDPNPEDEHLQAEDVD